MPISGLTIVLPEGEPLPYVGGILILDYSTELNEILIEIEGIPYPLYGELFPEHVEAYRNQFKK